MLVSHFYQYMVLQNDQESSCSTVIRARTMSVLKLRQHKEFFTCQLRWQHRPWVGQASPKIPESPFSLSSRKPPFLPLMSVSLFCFQEE